MARELNAPEFRSARYYDAVEGERAAARRAGRVSVRARHPQGHVPRAALDDAPVRRLRDRGRIERALSLPARARRRPGSRSPSICRRSSATTPTRRRRAARSARSASRSTRSPTWRRSSTASRSMRVTVSMTINAPASILLALLLAVARRRGIPFDKLGGTIQNDVLKEYVARGTYIYPPGPSMRLVTDVMAYCARERPAVEHDLDLRLSHPRSRLDRGRRDRVHARQRERRTCGPRATAGLDRRRRRAAHLVLLERAQRLLRRDRKVSRGAHAVGADRARRVRLARSALADAALSHPDRRLDADRARAREQRRARHAAGARRRARRNAVAAHQRQRRSARAADRRERRASRCARSRSSRYESGVTDVVDPLAGSYYVESLTDELIEARARADRRDRRDGRQRRGDRERLDAERASANRPTARSRRSSAARASSSASTRSPRRRRARRSRCSASTRRIEREQVDAAARVPRRARRRRASRRASPTSARAAEGTREPHAAASSKRSTRARRSARSATCCATVFGTYVAREGIA